MDLHDIVVKLKQRSDPNLLIGFDKSDDAAVYQINDEQALVLTTDFITPIVDDPFEFGQIAAANSLSDVYAKGGRPVTALNLCCFPDKEIPHQDLRAILEGGLSKIIESDALLVGGHTVRDPELKYGLAVTGLIRPKDMKANTGAKVGDQIILTKPIGTGIITTAGKKGLASPSQLKAVTESMKTLNRVACEEMLKQDAHAATDITGFGLLGHLSHVAKASHVSIRLNLREIPRFEGALEFVKQGIKTGVTFSNEQYVHAIVRFDEKITREEQLLCFDPQTSGGLAIFASKESAKAIASHLKANVIGEVIEGDSTIEVL